MSLLTVVCCPLTRPKRVYFRHIYNEITHKHPNKNFVALLGNCMNFKMLYTKQLSFSTTAVV